MKSIDPERLQKGLPVNGWHIPWSFVRWVVLGSCMVFSSVAIWVIKVDQGIEMQNRTNHIAMSTLDTLSAIRQDLATLKKNQDDDHDLVVVTANRVVSHDIWSRTRSAEIEAQFESMVTDMRALRRQTDSRSTQELLKRQAEERRRRDQEEEESRQELLKRLRDPRRHP